MENTRETYETCWRLHRLIEWQESKIVKLSRASMDSLYDMWHEFPFEITECVWDGMAKRDWDSADGHFHTFTTQRLPMHCWTQSKQSRQYYAGKIKEQIRKYYKELRESRQLP